MQPSFQPIALLAQPLGPGTRGIPPTAHTIVSGRIRPPYLFLLGHRLTLLAGELIFLKFETFQLSMAFDHTSPHIHRLA